MELTESLLLLVLMMKGLFVLLERQGQMVGLRMATFAAGVSVLLQQAVVVSVWLVVCVCVCVMDRAEWDELGWFLPRSSLCVLLVRSASLPLLMILVVFVVVVVVVVAGRESRETASCCGDAVVRCCFPLLMGRSIGQESSFSSGQFDCS